MHWFNSRSEGNLKVGFKVYRGGKLKVGIEALSDILIAARLSLKQLAEFSKLYVKFLENLLNMYELLELRHVTLRLRLKPFSWIKNIAYNEAIADDAARIAYFKFYCFLSFSGFDLGIVIVSLNAVVLNKS